MLFSEYAALRLDPGAFPTSPIDPPPVPEPEIHTTVGALRAWAEEAEVTDRLGRICGLVMSPVAIMWALEGVLYCVPDAESVGLAPATYAGVGVLALVGAGWHAYVPVRAETYDRWQAGLVREVDLRVEGMRHG